MKEKSIIKNTAVYSLKTISRLLVPLIIYPYISRILLPEGLGKYSFAESVLTYFSLLAGLGISNYAIRECTAIREDRARLEKTAAEIYSINVFSTVVSYLLLLVTVLFVPKIRANTAVLLILSIRIPLTTLGTEWIFNVYEEYTYITVRSIAFQIVSLILVFALIREPSDVNKYAAIVVLSDAGSNIFNYFYARKYFFHRISLTRELKKHIQPVLILFASMVAIQIYLNSDITMLGLMKTDYDVGIYTAAVKIYTIVQAVFSSMVSVSVPRMMSLYSQREENRKPYQEFTKNTVNGFIAFLIPASVGMILVAEQAVRLIFGVSFRESTSVLQILVIALLFSIPNVFFASAVLLMSGKEKIIFKATVAGASLNIFGNLFLIPVLGYTGCAVTTLVSEVIVFLIQLHYGKSEIKGSVEYSELLKVILACLPMIGFSLLINKIQSAPAVELALTVLAGSISYGVCLVLLRHKGILCLKEKIRITKRS